MYVCGLPWWLSGKKNPPANAEDVGSIPGSWRSPGEGNGNPLQYSCLGNPMYRNLAGSGTWGRKRVGHDLATKLQQQLIYIDINGLNSAILFHHSPF